MKKIITLSLCLGLLLFQSCKKKEETTPAAVKGCMDPKSSNYNPNATESDGNCTFDKTDDIVELAIRQVKIGQESQFISARTNFINLLTQESYVYNDREYFSFYHFNPSQDTSRKVYIGMTQYEDMATFQAVGNKLGGSTQATTFFGTFDALTFTALKPLVPGTAVDLSKIATGNQILEIAVRDLSLYTGFVKADYESKRDAFLAKLTAQSATVKEYQWVSVLNPNIVVGMTVYQDQNSFFQLSSNPTFMNDPAVQAFFVTYPPNMGGEVSTIIK